MDTIVKTLEEIKVIMYGVEFRDTNNLFLFIDVVMKDDILSTLEFEENKKVLKDNIISTLTSISRKIIEELKEDKSYISPKTEIKNGEVFNSYFDHKKKKYLSSRLDMYPTNDIISYHNKILQETVDFIGKKEVLDAFYKAYLSALSREATLETVYCKNMDALLDLFNDLRYKEVRENSILPALSDMAAEELSLNDLKFKNIKDAAIAYEKDGSLETLAQLKKLYIIQAIKNTENCFNREELRKMLNESNFDCVSKIIIKRLAYLDATHF